MKVMRTRQIGQKIDTNMLASVFYGSQFPVTLPTERCYDAIDTFVRNEKMVTRVEGKPGMYEVGFEKEQLSFLKTLMESFEMEEFQKMKPARIMIQKTGIVSANDVTQSYPLPPSNCVRFVLNYHKEGEKKQVGFGARMGASDEKLSPTGVLYTTRSFATVLQRNYSALEISSGRNLVDTRREAAISYFVIADLYAPAMLIMKIVNNTAGMKPIDFDKALAKPGVKNIVDGIMGSVDKGSMDMGTAMELVKKVISQNKGNAGEAAAVAAPNIADVDDM
jgi:hypothetical protein